MPTDATIAPATAPGSAAARALGAAERTMARLAATLGIARRSSVLETRLRQAFMTRAVYWIVFMQASQLVLLLGSHFQGTQQARSLLGLDALPFNASIWSAGIFTLFCLGILLHLRGRARTERAFGVAWLVLAVALSLWWTMGLYTLEDQPPPDSFKVAQRTFIWFTCMCTIVSIIFLAPSWKAVTGILFAFFAPAMNAFVHMKAPTIGLLVTVAALSAAIGLVAHVEQRRSMTKQLSLEAERRRSDELLRQLNELVASISHDLRQPLTTIALRLDSLRNHIAGNPAALGIHRVLDDQVQQMATLINSALDLSRLQSGQYPVNPRELPLQLLLQEIVRNFDEQARVSGIALRLHAPPLIVHSDREALGRIVSNLLSNALKYTPRGGRVLVGCRVRGDQVRLSVLDTGIGIDEKNHRIIFNEYVQLGNSERDRKKGLGLGLSIVGHLAQLLGVRVEVASVVGRGSRFTLTVPYKGRVPEEYRQVEVGDSAAEPDGAELAGMVAVVVDDDAELGDAMASRLADWGCHVVSGASFEEIRPRLVEMLGERRPDLLFCDYRLPNNRTGLDVVAQFREVYPELPATIWSGNTDPDTLRAVASCGLEFLSKPVPNKVLAQHLMARRAANAAAMAETRAA